jgi:hypothetical protein
MANRCIASGKLRVSLGVEGFSLHLLVPNEGIGIRYQERIGEV